MDPTIFGVAALISLFVMTKKKWHRASASMAKEVNDNLHQTRVPKDGIQSVDALYFLSAESVDGELGDYEDVFAVQHGSHSFVFPVKSLLYHHVVNFKSGSADLSLTYCPVSGVSRCFKGHKFGTTGKVYNANMVLYEKSTHSEVPQLLGVAVNGSLSGKKIPTLNVQRTTWGQWKQFHPESRVFSLRRDKFHTYRFDAYFWYGGLLRAWYPLKEKSSLFKNTEMMQCFEVNGQYYSLPKEKLRSVDAMNVSVNGRNVNVKYDKDLDVVEIREGEKSVDSFESYWFAWYASHPETKSLVL